MSLWHLPSWASSPELVMNLFISSSHRSVMLALPLSPFYRRGNEAQRGEVTHPRSHSTRVADLGFKGGQAGS